MGDALSGISSPFGRGETDPLPEPEAPAAADARDTSYFPNAHRSGLTAAELQRAREIAAKPEAPIPARGDRYEYEAALQKLSQVDTFRDTTADKVRCGAEVTVAALLMRGKRELGRGVASLEKYAKKTRPETPELKALAEECARVKASNEGRGVSPHDLARLADRLIAAFAPELDEIMKMQAACGLEPERSEVWTTESFAGGDLRAQMLIQEKAARKLYDSLGPGETCGIWVSARSGAGTGDHVALVGKKPDGTPFCYDSGSYYRTPNYLEGQGAIEHAALHCLWKNDKAGYVAFRHRHGGPG